MAVREVFKMGDPCLLETAQPVTHFNSPGLDQLLADMRDTMQALNGAGLAAPQIGVGLQVAGVAGFGIFTRVEDEPPLATAGGDVLSAGPMTGFAARLPLHLGAFEVNSRMS